MSAAEFSEKDLKLAVAAYCRDLCAPEPEYDPGHVFSKRYNDQIRKILSMSRRQIYMKRALRMAASLFIVLMLSFGAVMLMNGSARAAFVNWTVNIYNRIVDITFTHTGDDHAYIICTPGELPEGFELAEYYHIGYYTRSLYKKAEGQYIKLEYRRPTEKQKQRIEARSAGAETAVSAQGVKMFLEEGRNVSHLFWYEPHQDLAYYVESDLDRETLLRCFDTLNMRLPLYEPTWLPSRYEETDRIYDYPYNYIVYTDVNNPELLLLFYYSDMAETDLITIWKGHDDIEPESIALNNCNAFLFLPSKNDIGSELVWVDETNNLVFVLSGELSKEDIVSIANSVVMKD